MICAIKQRQQLKIIELGTFKYDRFDGLETSADKMHV